MPWPAPLLVYLLCHAAAEGGLADLVESDSATSPDELLEEGIRRLQEHGTWKRWEYEGVKFYSVDTFRQHMHEHHLDKKLLQLLPKDDPRGQEKPAEAAFRQRMCNLLQTVEDSWDQDNVDLPTKHGSEGRQGSRKRSISPPEDYGKTQTISTILSALEQVSDVLMAQHGLGYET